MSRISLLRRAVSSVRSFVPTHVFPRLLATSGAPSTDPHVADGKEVFTYTSLFKLAKIAFTLRDAIKEHAQRGLNSPNLLVQLEHDVDSALSLVTKALNATGRPCTAEQLASRKIADIVAGMEQALSYTDMLHARFLRDEIESSLVSLQVMPSLDSLLDGTRQVFSKKDIKGQRKKSSDPGIGAHQESELFSFQEGRMPSVFKEMRAVDDTELAHRKVQMEQAIDFKHILLGYETALLQVRRVHKVVRGGTNMSMRALVAIGNRNGVAGFGEGKSENVQHAIERACRDARRNMLSLDLWENRTVRHRLHGQFVRSTVDVWPAPSGTGISASNDFWIILKLFGLKDVGAKLRGSRSLTNSLKALFKALAQNSTTESIASKRERLADLNYSPVVSQKKYQPAGGL